MQRGGDFTWAQVPRSRWLLAGSRKTIERCSAYFGCLPWSSSNWASHGGSVVRAPFPVHGQASIIHHTQSRLFENMPETFLAGRYHSLIVDRYTLPPSLAITATSSDGLIMAMEHRDHPTFGVQFHPESVLTQSGYSLLANFARICGLDVTEAMPSGDLAELRGKGTKVGRANTA